MGCNLPSMPIDPSVCSRVFSRRISPVFSHREAIEDCDPPRQLMAVATVDPPAEEPVERPTSRYKLRRQTTGAFTLFHLLLPFVAVPWLFSWTGLISVVVGNFLFGSLGICLCYHRILTHRSLAVPRWLECTFAFLGICALQDSPAHWVAIHRRHHKHSDDEDDPHTPVKSFFWAHVGWLFVKATEYGDRRHSVIRKYAPDLDRDPFYNFLERGNIWVWVFVTHAVLFFVGGFGVEWLQSGDLLAATQFGLSMLLWGVVVRVVVTWHFTWSVNSVAHVWGYRNYETKDNSRNNWLVAMVTWGEGWHNNHHADQRSAAHGHRWWEFDATWLTIRILRLLGLAWNVVEPRTNGASNKP